MATYAIKWNEKILVTEQNKNSLEWYKFVQEELSEADRIELEKKSAIEQIATLSDQLNLLASTLEIVVSYIEVDKPEIANEPIIIQSRQVLNWIKSILEDKNKE